MEIYSIRCMTTGHIYVGSSKYSKEYRWDGSGFSHISRMNNGYSSKLYDEMRKYGLNDFKLKTIKKFSDEVASTMTQRDLQLLEDKYIKRYWDRLGKSRMLNAMRSAFSDPSVVSRMWTEDSKKRKHSTFTEKYGNPYGRLHDREFITPEKLYKMMRTNRANHGGVPAFCTKDARKKGDTTRNRRSKMLVEYKGHTYKGLYRLAKFLRSTGINIEGWTIDYIINDWTEYNYPEIQEFYHMKDDFKLLNPEIMEDI